MKKKAPQKKPQGTAHEEAKSRCAWCAKKLGKNQPVFGISMRLRPEAFSEVAPGTVESLYLPSAERTIPLIIVALDSPAKREGKDAMIQICSDACGIAAQEALRKDMAG
jgi:hypothetical protein